jgi:hypothetical protein
MYAVVAEWSTGGNDTRNFDELTRRMNIDEDPPAGLVVHSAGTTPEGGFRTYNIWETREAFEAFESERLMPAVEAMIAGLPPERRAAASPPERTVYPLHRVLVPSESSTRLSSGSRT